MEFRCKKESVENAMIALNRTLKKWGKGNQFWNEHKRLFRIC